MEGGKLRALVMIFLVLGMFVRLSTASFKNCYGGCFIPCVFQVPPPVQSCAAKCLKDCILPASTAQDLIHVNNQDYCKVGCASSLCTTISTVQNPGEEEVESCVNLCSVGCTKNYLLASETQFFE